MTFKVLLYMGILFFFFFFFFMYLRNQIEAMWDFWKTNSCTYIRGLSAT